MTILMPLFDFNEFICYLALMEGCAEGLAQGHNKWKALISVEWAEKKIPFILVSILLCSFMGRCYKDGSAGVPVLLAGQPKGPLSGQRPGVDGASARSAVQDCECLSAAWLLNNLLRYRELHPYMTPHCEQGCVWGGSGGVPRPGLTLNN